MRRLTVNAVLLTAGAYVGQLASALLYLLAARSLGPQAFGPLLGAVGIAVLLAGIADFGLNGWVTRALARHPTDVRLFQQTLSSKIGIATLAALLWLAIGLGFVRRPELAASVSFLTVYLVTLILTGTLLVPFRASENMGVVSAAGAIEKLAALATWWVLTSLSSSRSAAALAASLAVGGVVALAFAIYAVPKRFLAIQRPQLQTVIHLWRTSIGFGLVGLSVGILRADVAVVGIFAGPYASGVYAAPARLTTFLSIIPASFASAVYPRLAREHLTARSKRPEMLAAGTMLVLMAMALGLALVAAPIIIPYALGSAYESSVDVFRIYLIVVLVNAINQPLLVLLQAEGSENFAGTVVLGTALVGLVGIALGAMIAGAAGAALGALVLQIMALVLFSWKALANEARSGLPEGRPAGGIPLIEPSALSDGSESRLL